MGTTWGDYLTHKNKKTLQIIDLQGDSAEREGFEPPVPLGTTVFKTVVIDHSTISPKYILRGSNPGHPD